MRRAELIARPGPAAAVAALCALTAGCALTLPDYVPVSPPRTSGRAITLDVVNPEVELLRDPPLGEVAPHPYGTDPPLGEYVTGALREEFAAAGISVERGATVDAAVSVRIENATYAQAWSVFLLPLVAYQKEAGVMHLAVTVELRRSGRAFRRRFAGVSLHGLLQLLGVPFGRLKGAVLLRESLQRCLGELVGEVATLIEREE